MDDREHRLAAARKRSSARPSTQPADLPGISAQEFATGAGITVGGVYARIKRGTLTAVTVTDAGRKYVRIVV